MFLLFQFLRYHHGFCFQDLHSNMFLLFPFYPLGTHSFQKLIYIPICFYYFLLSTSGVCQFLAHLHSNMFLLFLYIAERLILCVQNLHSNMFLLFRLELLLKAGVIKIYIPICFYYFEIHILRIIFQQKNLHSNMFLLFPTSSFNSSTFSSRFTFQYVSIISRPM